MTAAFAPYTPAEAAKQHEAITRWLKPHEVDAIKAETLLDQRKQLAHTVMVVRATPKEVRT